MVYLMADLDRVYCKIGISDKPLTRLQCIQNSVPFKLELIRVVDGGRDLELQLLKKFSKYKAVGEWFNYNKEIENFLCTMPEIQLNKGLHKQKTKGVAEFRYNNDNDLGKDVVIDSPLTDNAKSVFNYCVNNHKAYKIEMPVSIPGLTQPTLYRSIGQLLRFGLISKANFIRTYFVNPYYEITNGNLSIKDKSKP